MIGFAAVYQSSDESLALLYWQIYCGSATIFAIVVYVAAQLLFSRFIHELETYLSRSTQKRDRLVEIIKRFKLTKKVFVIPIASVFLFIPCSFVLPMFSYLLLMNICAGLFLVGLIWYSITPSQQRQKFFPWVATSKNLSSLESEKQQGIVVGVTTSEIPPSGEPPFDSTHKVLTRVASDGEGSVRV